MNPWIRLYRESIHNPKIVTLNDRQHRAWHNCLLMADDAGVLPKMRDMACHMRMTLQEAEQVVCELVEVGLVDIDGVGADRKFKMHDWNVHQYVSDTSTNRVRKFRSKNKETKTETPMKRFSNGGVTPPEPDTDTETESKLQLSKQAAAREGKGKSELGFNLNSKSGSGSRDGMETLLRQAEGFGLDVDELLEITNRNNPKKREGYFSTLCVNRLKGQLPGLDDQIIRDALNGKHEQSKMVCALLVGAIP